ncbi:Na+/H+ antiporter [Actinomadura barringtoniae]|uniref:Na+/H+ antiporter n=1 Tax=Actinomadura barringtoniae TaxID=1427535 RepID=A0A939TAJ4_9ACTN|nr:Na+/H+ antiporter [Actinomadura barringtoniae]
MERELRLPPPVTLLACGVVLGFIPALRGVTLPPEAVLLLFLPALLYWESLTTSLREIRSNLRVIVLTSTVLVVATAAAVAVAAQWFGMPTGPAWVLGAALAPTDATAVAVLARGLPRRTMTILRAESLVNDGTALVIYGIAVGVVVHQEHLSPVHVSWLFMLAYVGGALAGLLVAWIAMRVRNWLDDPLLETSVSVLTPFTAFLLAELIEASGVLAVVVCGLVLSQYGPRRVGAETRQLTNAFWRVTTFILNGALFVLIGLQVQASIRDLTHATVGRGLAAVGLISAAVIGMRVLWSYTTPYIIRAIDRRPQQRLRRVGARQRLVSAGSGFRGAVSLAAALAVPELLDSGEPFPDRDLIVFVTTGVIVVTLVLQGFALPLLIRLARLPEDTALQEERRLAETVATEEALAVIPEVAASLGTSQPVLERTLTEYETHLKVLCTICEPEDDPVRDAEDDYAALRLALLARKRATIVRLRDERRIDDTVLRMIQQRLDIEEVRLARREVID